MRTLTLGVLIVSGGTLAALPFRRYPAVPDASAAPAAVTGPTESPLDPPLKIARSSTEAEPFLPELAESSLDALPAWPHANAASQPAAVEIPLTYEDLARPIPRPAMIEQRFTATAEVQQQREEEQQAALVMPDHETLAQKSFQPAAAPEVDSSPQPSAGFGPTFREDSAPSLPAESSQGNAGGSLASSKTPPERVFHWIRQPD